ncbi:delta and Notch-like epidermal growth factor-related receptor [Protopterus annectens]|uniref:delta and Notch-like epidermal growth factor-related receptor n=1 Tax=Protopterus annectens TaxID=7888 RepID=UPI001CFC09F4|nr:delta and Notch-like epidermal growth factor-related receptor [Protopterus annectens]
MPHLQQLLVLLHLLYHCVYSSSTTLPSPCDSQPCLNNGTCHPGSSNYNCTCSPGFRGANCEFLTNPCASNPCYHGNCSITSDGFICLCNDGYQGKTCDEPVAVIPTSTFTNTALPKQTNPVTPTQEPDAVSPTVKKTATLPPWQPKAGQKVIELNWNEIEMTPDAVCGNASSNNSAGGRLISFEVPQSTAVKIMKTATASLILMWKVTDNGFKQCSLIDGRSVTLLQASGGLILPEEMLSLGNNYFIGFVNDSITKCVVALRLNVIVKATKCLPDKSNANELLCSGKGKCITKPSEANFFCDCIEGYVGIYCEELNACHINPCLNNGSCTDIQQGKDGKNFTCSCLLGYTGELCQSVIDHCLPQPCENGGTCINSLTGYSCQCQEGFLGAQCEQKIDPCASSPCQNNGTCYADGLSYSCSCSPGYTGANCAQIVDFCALNPCAHGICRSMGTSYKCFCVPGYHGLYCEEQYNECLSSPCQNSATCKDLINGYECVCPAEYEGKHCEVYKDPCVNISCQNGGTCERERLNATCVCPRGFTGEECEIDIDECDSNPCHHGGTCVDQPNGYACHCLHGWVGTNCEIHLQWKAGRMAESLTNMPRHSLYIIIGALCVAFVLMLIILIVGICRISRIEYQGSSRPAYEEFYNCRSIDSEFSSAIASIRHARFGKKSRPAMYDATPIAYEDYSPDDKPLVTLIKTKDL